VIRRGALLERRCTNGILERARIVPEPLAPVRLRAWGSLYSWRHPKAAEVILFWLRAIRSTDSLVASAAALTGLFTRPARTWASSEYELTLAGIRRRSRRAITAASYTRRRMTVQAGLCIEMRCGVSANEVEPIALTSRRALAYHVASREAVILALPLRRCKARVRVVPRRSAQSACGTGFATASTRDADFRLSEGFMFLTTRSGRQRPASILRTRPSTWQFTTEDRYNPPAC